MDAPVRAPDDGPSKDGLSNYAPKKARRPEKGDRAASESAEPPWKRSRHQEAFAGNAAIAARRNKLALAPDRIPEPSARSTGTKYVLVGRLAGVVVVTAVGVVGYQLGSSGPASWPPLTLRPGLSDQEVLSERSVPAAGGLSTGTMADYARGISSSAVANAAPVAYPPRSEEPALALPAAAIAIPRNAASAQAVSRKLTVGAVPPQQADEGAKLAVSAGDAGASASVVIGGLAPGSALSAGIQEGPN